MSSDPAISAEHRAHYEETVGTIPDALVELNDFDPAYFAHFTEQRMLAYGEGSPGADGGAGGAGLDPITRELVFVVIDAVVNNPGGARAHLRAAAGHGLRLEQVRDLLRIVLYERGAHGWVDGIRQIWAIAVEELG